MRVLIARPVPTHSPPHPSSHPCPSTTPLPPTPPFCTPHQRASILRHGDTLAPPSALAMAAPPALPLPLPFVAPAPLVYPPRLEPNSRIYVACILLKAYPRGLFMELAFAKKRPQPMQVHYCEIPAPSSSMLKWLQRGRSGVAKNKPALARPYVSSAIQH